eukprot:gene14191-biopygen18618
MIRRRQKNHLANPERWPSVDKCSLETTWPIQRPTVRRSPARDAPRENPGGPRADGGGLTHTPSEGGGTLDVVRNSRSRTGMYSELKCSSHPLLLPASLGSGPRWRRCVAKSAGVSKTHWREFNKYRRQPKPAGVTKNAPPPYLSQTPALFQTNCRHFFSPTPAGKKDAGVRGERGRREVFYRRHASTVALVKQLIR